MMVTSQREEQEVTNVENVTKAPHHVAKLELPEADCDPIVLRNPTRVLGGG
jgi:hypothetical protein